MADAIHYHFPEGWPIMCLAAFIALMALLMFFMPLPPPEDE